jgi:hypothetical protein
MTDRNQAMARCEEIEKWKFLFSHRLIKSLRSLSQQSVKFTHAMETFAQAPRELAEQKDVKNS